MGAPYSQNHTPTEISPDAQLIKIDVSGHGFSGQYYEFALKTAPEFVINVYN